MKREIIITHCGKLGDMLYCLPIMKWLADTRGVTIHIVLPKCFPPFRYVEKLLLAQSFVSKVTYVDHECGWSGHAGQPYKFNPATFGIEGEYYNFGFRAYPNKFVIDFIAEEHGFGWDRGFTLNFGLDTGSPLARTDEILRSEQPEIAAAVPHAAEFPIPMDLYELGRKLILAKEIHLWYSGPAAMMFLARHPFNLHFVQGHPPREIYLPKDKFGGALINEVFNSAPSRP